MKIFYIGWIGYNNIGDDLMLDVFRKMLNAKDKNKYGIYPSYPEVDLKEINNYDIIVLGGGSILVAGYIDVLYRAIEKGKKVLVWGAGYDLLEKEFIDKIENTSIPAYLYTEEEEIKLDTIANNAIFFGVRGPLTYKILEKSFVNMENIIISGDPGLMLEIGNIPDKCPIKYIDEKEKIIAVNFGTSYNRVFGKDEKGIQSELIKVCNNLILKGYKIYLFSMWDKDLTSINRLYNGIIDNKNVIYDNNLYTGEELAAILRKCRITINLKLHANIISSVANTPFICLGYRMKCYDFAKSIACDDLIISTDDLELANKVLDKVNYIEGNYYKIKTIIKENVNKYKELLKDSLNLE